MSIGATGEFPDGKIHPDDEGEIRLGVADDGTYVLINFGTPVAFLAFPPRIARDLAKSLLEHARNVERRERLALSRGGNA